MFTAERILFGLMYPPYARTHTQSNQDIECVPRGHSLNVARSDSPPTTAMCVAALQWERQRFRAVYRVAQLRAQRLAQRQPARTIEPIGWLPKRPLRRNLSSHASQDAFTCIGSRSFLHYPIHPLGPRISPSVPATYPAHSTWPIFETSNTPQGTSSSVLLAEYPTRTCLHDLKPRPRTHPTPIPIGEKQCLNQS